MPEMTTVDELAAKFRVSRWTIYRLVKSGEIGCVRIGATIRFTEAQVRMFVRTNRRQKLPDCGDGQG